MNTGYTELRTYRYERKFVATGASSFLAESIIKQNNAFFTPAFYPRNVNNIYLDTPGLDCYFDNLFGNGHRWKARIRWYGEIFGEIKMPILEFKIKKGFVGTKKSFHLPAFNLDKNDFRHAIFESVIAKAELPDEICGRIKIMQPVLLNSYQRSYFSSLNKKFRITIDNNLEYYNLRSSWNFFPKAYREEMKTVIELKYDEKLDSEAEKISNEFPFRLDKNSKFVAGMSYFRSDIPE